MAKAAIFDYDGVLNDSLDIIRRLYNEFQARGMTKRFFSDCKEFSNFFQGDIYRNMIEAGMEPTEENFKKCDAITKEVLDRLDPEASLFQGVHDMIVKLKADGYKLGIVSNGNKEIIIAKLKRNNLDHAFGSVVGYEQVSKPKPNPEGLIMCLKELDAKPEEALYIGDAESDVKAAKAANVKVIAVTYGYYKYRDDMLKKLSGADMLASNVEELHERIRNA